MTIETIYYASQIVAAIVIIATLLAILWQGYQTNKIARADLSLNMWLQMGSMHNSVVDTPEKGELFARAFSDAERLTEGEKMRLSFNLSMLIGTHEAAFNLRSRGLIEEAVYARSASTTRSYMTFAIMRRWWKRNRNNGYSAAFRKEIDAMTNEFEAAASGRAPGIAPAAEQPATMNP
jgi:hypothetical protein